MTAPPEPESVSDGSRSRWSRALGERGESEEDRREAFGELAASYWYSVYAWWRRAGLDEGQAPTATLASVTRWLGEAPPDASDSGAGRMREWLPARLAELAREGVELQEPPAAIPMDPAWAEQRYADEPPGEPDAIFQRRWALTVIEFTESTLQSEYSARGEEALFAELVPFAGFEPAGDERYAAAAARTGRTGGAMHKAVFDFRTRQRELLRAFVADTVRDPAAADSEITALLCACDAAAPEAASAPLPSAIRSLRPDEMFARAMQSVRMTGAGAGGWQPPTVAEAARLFPQYEVLSLLGRGGMGAVYKARQIELDRLIAIKLLPLEVSVDKDFAERFRREARAMAKLDHPNIIGVHEFGATSEGHLFFAMAFVEGANLHEVIHGPGLSPAQALEIIGGVCDALAYAHGKGIVHRDIKPANVMVSAEGRVKVADFGLARLTEAAAEPLGHTVTGIVMGTPDYMAPEQKRQMNVDHRADIYSLGVMLYEMLCREVPQGVFDPPSARVAGVDARVDQMVTKAMQQQPERRYQSTQEMKTAVAAASTLLPGASKRKGAASSAPGKSKGALYAGLAVVAIAAAAAIFWAKTKAGGGPVGVHPVSPAAKAGESSLARRDTPSARPPTPSSPILPRDLTPAANVANAVSATKDAPFVNTLGMKFVPVPIIGGPTGGQRVLFSVWDTRVQDYETFVKETRRGWTKAEFPQGPTHPAVLVSWEDAQLFCQWLTLREQTAGRLPAGFSYRLPSDHEWSCAVELGAREDAAKLPVEKAARISDVFPWGAQWPPPKGAGNYLGEELRPAQAAGKYAKIKAVIAGYSDDFVETLPVGSFAANRFGLFDIGGNVWQWCEDWYDKEQKDRALRGASWRDVDRRSLLSSGRTHYGPAWGSSNYGFRCVIAPVSAAPLTAAVPAQTVRGTAGATPAASPSTPAPSAPQKPPTEVEKWLAQVDAPQQEAFQKQVRKPFETGGADLQSRYRAALDARIARASAANQLDEALAWRTERQTFDKAQNVAPDDAGIPAAVKALRADFREQLAKLDQDRASRAKALLAQYDAILAKNETLLTQRARLDDALLLKTKRDEIALAWLGASLPGNDRAPGRPDSGKSSAALMASKDLPFVNSLGMKFVPVPIIGGPTSGQRVLFSVWDTRVQDYEAFVKETKRDWPKPDFPQGPTHPAVSVSWDDAQLFCQWLTSHDRAAGLLPADWRYRLPSDHEWSCAVEIGAREDAGELPSEKARKIANVYPWGTRWPPPKGAGNYAGEELRSALAAGKYNGIKEVIAGYDDGFESTSPVGSFAANRFGLFDIGGNVWQWCEDWRDKKQVDHVLRGASWRNNERNRLLSSERFQYLPGARFNDFGFRCVVGASGR